MLLLGLVGRKRHGKDTFCQYLLDELRALAPGRFHLAQRFAFADPVKLECLAALRHAGLDLTLDQLEADKETFRPFLQWWGTEFRRGYFGHDYWIRRLEETLNAHTDLPLAIVTDVRFPNEADMIRRRSGRLIRLIRLGFSLPDPHPSELIQGAIPCDGEIHHLALSDLRTAAWSLARELAQ